MAGSGSGKKLDVKKLIEEYIKYRIERPHATFLEFLRYKHMKKRKIRRLTPEEKAKIKEALDKGYTIKEVAKMFGVSRTTVERIRGVVRPYSMSRERAEKVIQLLIQGVKPKEIAEKFGIAVDTVHVIKHKVLYPNSEFYRKMHEKYAKYFLEKKESKAVS